MKNSHSYAVLSRVERVAHVIPCFLVGVTFPLDVRFPAVSSVRFYMATLLAGSFHTDELCTSKSAVWLVKLDEGEEKE